MLHFRDQHWLRVNGSSRIYAYITPKYRRPEDVHWTLQLRYVAGGPAWRRVQMWHRPEVWIEVSSFRPPGPRWSDIERFDAWTLPKDDDEYFDHWRGGYLDVRYYPRQGAKGAEATFCDDHIWRVAGRDGRWFTVELAAFADGRNILKEMLGLPVAATPDGAVAEDARGEPDEDFWRRHAELYAIERVPFGTAMVVVPRNVRDPQAYAIGRARALLGTGDPEHANVDDYDRPEFKHENMRQDLHVTLHFNGYYED